ncbi:MAG: topoisomerase IV [Clostridia bacterium]|nr:topoisomerase IV [Clostridia bacterium]MBR3863222.1 topoisomerase IV [Clostridia bacterium]
MAKKRSSPVTELSQIIPAPATPQPITETIEKNYMPYVMSVIVSRAIPEIDGFKPSHRKLLYTMYKMGLLTGARTKSANIVGQTMKLNPHGDAAIYETMVRLTRGNATLLHPFVDSKGSFGKQYSSDMKYAASRYTEAKLDSICHELFAGIDKDAVDLVDNYDGTMKEPVLLPTTFPNVLVTPNVGIAVGMASNICSFNLGEVCDGAIALLKNPKASTDRILDLIKAPDFSGGGLIVYDRDQMRRIYETGQGSFRIRSRYSYDKAENCIDISQIPYSTTIEAIRDSIAALVKEGKVKEITDFRDEIGINGFRLTLDLRRGTDPDKLMNQLFKLTPLEDSFKCNFNVLINSVPRQLGVVDILKEWITFRIECVRRELRFDLKKKRDRLHLVTGLGKILLDIDKAVRIIRHAESDDQVVPELMRGFGIDQVQADYIANIKLRNLNKKYIVNCIQEMEALKQDIAEIEDILADDLKLRAKVATQLAEIKKKHGQPRRSQLIFASDIPEVEEIQAVENYPVRLVLTKEGYFKKITFQSLRGNDEQKLKEGDSINQIFDAENRDNLLIFTDKAQVYRVAVNDFDTTKASAMGDFLNAKLGMEKDERPIFMHVQNTYPEGENMLFVFENGKGVRIPITAYVAKGNRRKLTGAFSDASAVVGIFYEVEKNPFELMLLTDADRAIVIKSSLIPIMSTRSSKGNTLISLGKKEKRVTEALTDFTQRFGDAKGYRKYKIPAAGVLLNEKNIDTMQLSMDDTL